MLLRQVVRMSIARSQPWPSRGTFLNSLGQTLSRLIAPKFYRGRSSHLQFRLVAICDHRYAARHYTADPDTNLTHGAA